MDYFSYSNEAIKNRGTTLTNLRSRIMARCISGLASDEWNGNQNYKNVILKIQQASKRVRHHKIDSENGTPFTHATWSRWYNGQKPNSTSVTLLDLVFDGAASHWLRPNLADPISRNLTLIEALHGHIQDFPLNTVYKQFCSQAMEGHHSTYHELSFSNIEYKPTNDSRESIDRPNYWKHLSPGNPYTTLIHYLSFLFEDVDIGSPNLDLLAFDYASICIFQMMYLDLFWQKELPLIPPGEEILLTRACMSHLFLGVTEDELPYISTPDHLSRITECLNINSIDVDVETVESTLNKLKFTYFSALSTITGLPQKSVMKILDPGTGF